MFRIKIKNSEGILTNQAEFDTEAEATAWLVSEHFVMPYSHTIEDITAEILTERESFEALKYLSETDWYIIREMDTEVPCPADIKLARAAARLKIL